MARKSDLELVESLLQRYEPRLRAAFIASIRDITSNATLRVIARRLEAGDIAGAIDAVGLDPDAFAPLDLAISEAYYGSGQETVDNWPTVRDADGSRVIFRFGVRNNEAENWLRLHSSRLVTRIVQDQREGIRLNLMEGMAQGLNPNTVALDIVGRINRNTQRREGGIIGLTAQQSAWVSRARSELRSGDPAQMANYLNRKRRDRRFDRTVEAAIRDERALTEKQVAKMTGRYSDRLLALRGETIARTEMLASLNKARDDAIRQQILAGKIDAQDVTKVWRAAFDDRVRDTHRALNGKSVPLEGAFTSPSGATLKYPGDPDAPPEEHINCRCYLEINVDFLASVVRRNRAA